MNVISNRKFLFVKDTIVQEPTLTEGMTRVQKIEDTFTLEPDPQNPQRVQSVPDWVKDTDQFKNAIKDKAIVETASSPTEDTETDNKKPVVGGGAKTGTGL